MSVLTRTAWNLDSPRGADWRSRADCRGRDPEWWSVASGLLSVENETAQWVCRGCPVAEQCAGLAVTTGATDVIHAATVWRGGKPCHTYRCQRCDRTVVCPPDRRVSSHACSGKPAGAAAKRGDARAAKRRATWSVDEVAVDQAVRGELSRKLSRGELPAAVARLYGQVSMGEIARRVGCNPRTARRIVVRLGLTKSAAP